MLGRLGTMYVVLVARLLTSLLRLSLAPFSVMFVLVFVDSFCSILKVRLCRFFARGCRPRAVGAVIPRMAPGAVL